MSFGHYSYLVTTLLFAGGAVSIEYLFGFHTLRRFWKAIALTTAFGFILGPIGEAVALRWGAWAYNPAQILDVLVEGVPVETFLFSLLVSIAVSSAAIYWAHCEDRGYSIVWHTFEKVKRKLVSGATTGEDD